MSLPLAIPDKNSCFCSSVPAAIIASPLSTTVEKNGPGTTLYPIASSRTPKSRKLPLPPPYFSGNGNPIHPSSAIFCHNSGEKPLSLSSSCLTSCLGHSFCRKSRAEVFSISCSSLRPKSILCLPFQNEL